MLRSEREERKKGVERVVRRPSGSRNAELEAVGFSPLGTSAFFSLKLKCRKWHMNRLQGQLAQRSLYQLLCVTLAQLVWSLRVTIKLGQKILVGRSIGLPRSLS